MKILKVNELNENFEKNILEGNDKIQKLKDNIEIVYHDAYEEVYHKHSLGYVGEPEIIESFEDYWDENGDRIIQEFGVLEEKEKPKQRGNIRQILPEMVRLSNNSRMTQDMAQKIVDTFTPVELNEFENWLGNCRST